jgi:hypothetical protein
METEMVYKNTPFTLRVLRNELEGYVFTIEPIRLYEVNKNKLRLQVCEYIKALQALLEVLGG